jgi:hypothetical protein
MVARLTFLGIVAFWLTMNVLLWRMEFGTHGGDTPVPPVLVWHKILTASDASSLNFYQKGDRMGFCEISTGVSQQMATFDENKLPVEGFSTRGGYQLQAAGTIAVGDFTNRVKFDGRMVFDHARHWRELSLKITTRGTVIEIHTLATNQTAHLKFTSGGILLVDRDMALADLQNPGVLFQSLAGYQGSDPGGALDVAELLPGAATQKIEWVARRTRIKIGAEAMPVYRLETSLLGHSIIVDVSTLGEILRLDLPGGITAHIEAWNRHD